MSYAPGPSAVSVSSRRQRLVIGTYTEQLPHVAGQARGILACSFEDGIVGPPTLLCDTRNPSWLTPASSGDRVYAVNETVEFDGNAGGGVTAFAFDARAGSMVVVNSRPSQGAKPAHLALDSSERFLLVANYGSGSIAVYRRRDDGGIGEITSHVQHSGHGVRHDRQTGPHAHMIAVDPVTGLVLVPDLGLDAVFVYRLADDGILRELEHARIGTRPGAGPRHVAFHPDGRHLFLVNELDNTLVSLRRRDDVTFETVDTRSTLPVGHSGPSYAAAVRVSPSGGLVFASNRGFDSIAIFKFDRAAGRIELAALAPTDGRGPRDFTLSPDGRFLIVANMDTNTLVTFALDEDVPRLTKVSVTDVFSPVCLQWLGHQAGEGDGSGPAWPAG